MSERPNQEQMAKIIVPALAVAAVIVLIAVLVANWSKPDLAVGGGGKSPSGLSPTMPQDPNYSIEGTTMEKPPADSPEWKELEAGLKSWDVKEGEGEPCRSGANVTIHYTGWLLDGKIFDSSVRKGEVANFPLGTLIQGWQRGIPGMKPGGIRRLYIPWAMAYGANGGNGIPPKADLIFEIKYYKSN